MNLANDERIFIIIFIVNLVVSLIYLLAGILFVVPAKSVAEDKEKEVLRDNRKTYLLRFFIMALCPIIGPLFFFIGYVFYLFVFRKSVDLEDVIFSKERVRVRMKADEERERDIIPLEEAVMVNEKKDLRLVMMNVIKEDIRNSLASITLALSSEDSEASHYAAAVLSDELNKFRFNAQKLWKQIQDEPEQTEYEEMLIDYMDNILKQRIFSVYEQRKFVDILEQTAELLYGEAPSKFTVGRYEEVCLRTLEVKDYEHSEKWCLRMAEQFPEELPSYTCRLKLYFAKQDREAFFETLNFLKKSNVIIDNETLELIRVFS